MEFKKELIPLAVVLGIGLYSVWPMVTDSNLVPAVSSDSGLIAWIMHQPIWSFAGNNFYPYKNVLAYSDMHKLSALVSGGQFATSLVYGQLATMLVVYLWWKKWFKNNWAAAVAAIALGLAQFRWEYKVHLQMWNMQYWLLASWLIISGLGGKWRRLYLGAVLLGLQFYESPLPVYFAAAALCLWILVFRPKFSRHWVLAALLAAAVWWPAAGAYLGVSREFNFVRDIREAAHISLSLDELSGRFFSPGLFVLLILALFKLDWSSRRVKFLALTGVLGLVMALGPVFKWQDRTVRVFGRPIPLPYAVAYYVVPGWKAFRVPSRWLWVSIWAASGLIAAGLAGRKQSDSNWYRWGLAMAAVVAVAGGTRLSYTRPLPLQIPAVYLWLKDQPGRVVLELPVFNIPHEAFEVERMYFSLYHGKMLVNGYSGFIPPLVDKLVSDPLPNIPAGTDYVIDHNSSVSVPGKVVYHDRNSTVYKLDN
ncbi:MAG: hypothetical protein Q7S31_01575 [bacterium]|nr:hypothetical protein [bacterium]